jgi:hypothetical protein
LWAARPPSKLNPPIIPYRSPGELACNAQFAAVATPALADDTMSHVTMTKSQQLKDCIERQKSTDVTMSKTDMKKLCKDQLKLQKQSGVSPEPPPVDAPRD